MNKIKSNNNTLIKQIKKLLNYKKERLKKNTFILEGIRSIEGAIRSNSDIVDVKKIIVSSSFKQSLKFFEPFDKIVVDHNIFNKISDVKHHQGIMAIVSYKKYISLIPKFKKILLLENINDPGNAGTLIRSAVAAKYDAIILIGKYVDYTNPKTVRASMGSICFIPIIESSLDKIIEFAKDDYCLISTVPKNGIPIFDYKFGEKFILTIGSEAHGISEKLLKSSNDQITIPISNKVESLNAAVAGSMMMLYSSKLMVGDDGFEPPTLSV